MVEIPATYGFSNFEWILMHGIEQPYAATILPILVNPKFLTLSSQHLGLSIEDDFPLSIFHPICLAFLNYGHLISRTSYYKY